MRKSLIVAAGLLLAACDGNNNAASPADSSKTSKDSVMAMRPIQSPFPITYSSSFTIDDPKNAESLLALWKSYDAGNPASTKNLIADTLVVYTSDGMMIKGSRDSVTGMVQKERDSYKSVTDRVNAIMALKSDKGDHWALIWGSEKRVDKKGKVDSSELQQTWRFNANGQADLMYEFEAKSPRMPAMK